LYKAWEKELGFWVKLFPPRPFGKTEFLQWLKPKGGRFQSPGSCVMKHYEKMLEGITGAVT